MFKRIFLVLIFSVSVLGLVFGSSFANALPSSFNQSIIIDDSDFYELPASFEGLSRAQSIAAIQLFLKDSGSVLADLTVKVEFGSTQAEREHWLEYSSSKSLLSRYLGSSYSFAELVWILSQETMIADVYDGLPIDQTLNPLYILSLVQKESGLVYGTCAKFDSSCSQSVQFRLDRMLGYYCPDGERQWPNGDWSNTFVDSYFGTCNPDFNGVFKQLYFGLRWKKGYAKKCVEGFDAGGERYEVGSSISVSGQSVLLSSALACANYYYTPHVFAQELFYDVTVQTYDLFDTSFDRHEQYIKSIVSANNTDLLSPQELTPIVVESPEVDLDIIEFEEAQKIATRQNLFKAVAVEDSIIIQEPYEYQNYSKQRVESSDPLIDLFYSI